MGGSHVRCHVKRGSDSTVEQESEGMIYTVQFKVEVSDEYAPD